MKTKLFFTKIALSLTCVFTLILGLVGFNKTPAGAEISGNGASSDTPFIVTTAAELQEALNATTNTVNYIRLACSIESSEKITVNGKEAVIDLNEKYLSLNGSEGFIEVYENLTVQNGYIKSDETAFRYGYTYKTTLLKNLELTTEVGPCESFSQGTFKAQNCYLKAKSGYAFSVTAAGFHYATGCKLEGGEGAYSANNNAYLMLDGVIVEGRISELYDGGYDSSWKTSAQAPWDGSIDTSWYNETDNTFVISTPAALAGLAQLVIPTVSPTDSFAGKTVKLGSDINLGGWGWVGIGTNSYQFMGTFDGDGHSVNGLWISTNRDYMGLFGLADSATIKNLTVNGRISVSVNGSTSLLGVGGIAGGGKNAVKILNCVSNVDTVLTGFDSSKINVGGIIGIVNSSSAVIDGCVNNGNIVAGGNNSSQIGGIVGHNEKGRVINCYNTGSVSAYNAAGIVGKLGGSIEIATVENCYNTGKISAINREGGIISTASINSVTKNCYNLGEFSKTATQTGSLVGDMAVGTGSNKSAVVENCYAVSDGSNLGFVGYVNAAVPVNCDEFDGEAREVSYNGAQEKVSLLDALNLYIADLDDSTLTTWVVSSSENNGYPTLHAHADLEEADGKCDICGKLTFEGKGTETEPYIVKTLAELKTAIKATANETNYINLGGEILGSTEIGASNQIVHEATDKPFVLDLCGYRLFLNDAVIVKNTAAIKNGRIEKTTISASTASNVSISDVEITSASKALSVFNGNMTVDNATITAVNCNPNSWFPSHLIEITDGTASFTNVILYDVCGIYNVDGGTLLLDGVSCTGRAAETSYHTHGDNDGDCVCDLGKEEMHLLSSGSNVCEVCGAHCHDSEHAFEEWSKRGGEIESGYYYLVYDDTAIRENLTVTGDVVLCLNGKTMNLYGGANSFTINSGASLTICDCTKAGTLDCQGKGITNRGGRLFVADVTIKGYIRNLEATGATGELHISGGTVTNDGDYAILSYGENSFVYLSNSPTITANEYPIEISAGSVIYAHAKDDTSLIYSGEALVVNAVASVGSAVIKEVSDSNKEKFSLYGGHYYLKNVNGDLVMAQHEHSWKYELDGATITAACSGEFVCEYEGTDFSVTLSAPEKTVYLDDKSADATLSAMSIAGQSVLVIKYAGREDTVYAESETAPSNAGKYTASITVGEVTASVDYEIAKRTLGVEMIPWPSDLKGSTGEKLTTVDLTEFTTSVNDQFVWENPDALIIYGVNGYAMSFVPNDLTNFNIVTNSIEVEGLHVHSWSNTWSANEGSHWHECTAEHCEVVDNARKDGYATHSAPNDDGDCETAIKCHVCEYVFKAADEHAYDNACDTACNNLGCTEGNREISHVPQADDGNCLTEVKCSICQAVTTEAENSHSYDNACDTACNNLGCTAGDRAITHAYDNDCDTTCNVCESVRSIEHSYGEWTTAKEPTEDSEGLKEKTCSVCGDKQTESLPKIENKGLGAGGIIGIVLGSLAIVGAAVFFIIKAKKKGVEK